jgi:nucleoside-diphosphate-sugar epimerase
MTPSPDGRGRVRVLLTRPDSYLGLRLMRRLLDDPAVSLRLLTKDSRRIADDAIGRAVIVEGDPLDEGLLAHAAREIDVAYFPTRFLRSDGGDAAENRLFAQRFRDACVREGVGRIVFLGVHGGACERSGALATLSEIGDILAGRPDAIRTVCLRNDYIIGSGSMLFEALRSMARYAPVLLAPRWMDAKPAVTGVGDTLEYMVRAAHLPLDRSIVVDIGLAPANVRELVAMTARAMGLRPLILRIPALGQRGAALLLTLVSPLSWRLASSFIKTMKSILRCGPGGPGEPAERIFPGIEPLSPAQAIGRALLAMDEDRVESRWTDSLPGHIGTDADAGMARAKFRDVRTATFGDIPPDRVFRAITSIGGRQGWFTFDFLWRIRGFLDKLAGGYGISVGRRTSGVLRVGDFLDVWKVVDIQEDRRLLLEAQMKVAGKAWLEFRIEGDTLVQTACHVPEGIPGHLYWYSMVPFHAFIFKDMVQSIVRRAKNMA